MGKTYRHIKAAAAAKESREYRQKSFEAQYAQQLEEAQTKNQSSPYTHAKHHSDLRFACNCHECVAVLRSKHGGSRIRRIRRGERRSIRMALTGGGDQIDLTRRVRVPILS